MEGNYKKVWKLLELVLIMLWQTSWVCLQSRCIYTVQIEMIRKGYWLCWLNSGNVKWICITTRAIVRLLDFDDMKAKAVVVWTSSRVVSVTAVQFVCDWFAGTNSSTYYYYYSSVWRRASHKWIRNAMNWCTDTGKWICRFRLFFNYFFESISLKIYTQSSNRILWLHQGKYTWRQLSVVRFFFLTFSLNKQKNGQRGWRSTLRTPMRQTEERKRDEDCTKV